MMPRTLLPVYPMTWGGLLTSPDVSKMRARLSARLDAGGSSLVSFLFVLLSG